PLVHHRQRGTAQRLPRHVPLPGQPALSGRTSARGVGPPGATRPDARRTESKRERAMTTAHRVTPRAVMAGLFVACLLGSAPPGPGRAVAEDGAPGPQPSAGERVPSAPELATKPVTFWEGRARRDPAGFIEWRELAAAYLARQRETGDIADAVEAEGAARRSL